MSLLEELQKKKLKKGTQQQKYQQEEPDEKLNEEILKDLTTLNLFAVGSGAYGRLARNSLASESKFVNCLISRSYIPESSPLNSTIQFTHISCGAGHVLALDTNNYLYTWGKCHYGQLGHGEMDKDEHLPRRVQSLEPFCVRKIGAGDSFSCAVVDKNPRANIDTNSNNNNNNTSKGMLYTWGCGFYGPLGHGDESTVVLPKLVEDFVTNNVEIEQISGGAFHVAVLADKKIYISGKNKSGQLGLGDKLGRRKFTLVSADVLQNVIITGVDCGLEHTVCVSEDGRMFGWGNNTDCRIGRPLEHKEGQDDNETLVLTPREIKTEEGGQVWKVAASNQFTVVLTRQGKLRILGAGTNRKVTIKNNFNEEDQSTHQQTFQDITCGETHFLALSQNDHTLWTWGTNNDFGKLGRGGEFSFRDIKPVPSLSSTGGHIFAMSAGSNHSFALLKPGSKTQIII